MIRLLPVLLAVLLASCASKLPKVLPTQAQAPTVPTLTPVAPPSTGGVSPLLRDQAREIAKARNENARLQRFVFESQETNASLEELLHASLEVGQADKARLAQIDVLVHREQKLNAELQTITAEQALTISLVSSRNEELSAEVQTLGERIAVSNRRLLDTGSQLEIANSRIEKLTKIHNDSAQVVSEWKGKADAARGTIDLERRWKWRFFWWGTVASGLIGVYLFVRMHPATRALVP